VSLRRQLHKHRPRVKPHVAVRGSSPNRYHGHGRYLLAVLHDTEGWNYDGTADLSGIVSFFGRSSTQASSQVCTDDDGLSARIVTDSDTAWHCADFNPVSLGIEQVGFAAQRRWSRKELKETARWLAQWSHEYGIPLRRGIVRGSTVVQSGVVTHKQLGVPGGGHTDPGSGYPVRRVLRWAKLYRALRYRGGRPRRHSRRKR
jgi:hypothetical protein